MKEEYTLKYNDNKQTKKRDRIFCIHIFNTLRAKKKAKLLKSMISDLR